MIVTRLIQLVHIAVILYVVLGPHVTSRLPQEILQPFVQGFNISMWDALYLIVVAGIVIHWIAGSDVCALSLLESLVSGKHYTEGFIHRLVAPIYTFPNGGEHQLTKISYLVVFFNIVFVLLRIRKTV